MSSDLDNDIKNLIKKYGEEEIKRAVKSVTQQAKTETPNDPNDFTISEEDLKGFGKITYMTEEEFKQQTRIYHTYVPITPITITPARAFLPADYIVSMKIFGAATNIQRDAVIDSGADTCSGPLYEVYKMVSADPGLKLKSECIFDPSVPPTAKAKPIGIYVDCFVEVLGYIHRITLAGARVPVWLVGRQGVLNNMVYTFVGTNVKSWVGPDKSYGPGVLFHDSSTVTLEAVDKDLYKNYP